jgi:hypothetical protein
VLSGIIATLTGPATAILAIPRIQDWPAGGMIFWMNGNYLTAEALTILFFFFDADMGTGSDAQLWPALLAEGSLEGTNCSTDFLKLNNQGCPSSAFTALYSHFSNWSNMPDSGYQVLLQSPKIRTMMYTVTGVLSATDTWAYTAHNPSANLQDATISLYQNSMLRLKAFYPNQKPYPKALDLATTKQYELDTKLPAVRASCLHHNDTVFQDDIFMLTFPELNQWTSYRSGGKTVAVNATSVAKDYLSSRGLVTTNDSSVNLIWPTSNLIAIPVDIAAGDAGSLGLVLLRPNNGTVTPFTCTIDARWAQGSSFIESSNGEALLSHDFANDTTRNIVQAVLKNDAINGASPMWQSWSTDAWSNVDISTGWYDRLSPSIPDSAISWLDSDSPNNQTLLERLLTLGFLPAAGEDPLSLLIEHLSLELVISMFFVGGMSRTGTQHQIETWKLFPSWPSDAFYLAYDDTSRSMVRYGDPEETFPKPSILDGYPSSRMMMRAIYNGYVMTLSDWFDRLSAAILLAHAALVIWHIVYVLRSRKTSQAWDTTTEMLVLAMQSQPAAPGILENICAGVDSRNTLSRIASIKVANAKDEEDLQLRFRTAWEEHPGGSEAEVSKEYGFSTNDRQYSTSQQVQVKA